LGEGEWLTTSPYLVGGVRILWVDSSMELLDSFTAASSDFESLGSMGSPLMSLFTHSSGFTFCNIVLALFIVLGPLGNFDDSLGS